MIYRLQINKEGSLWHDRLQTTIVSTPRLISCRSTGDDEEAKAAICEPIHKIGRTTHLHEMRAQEYKECCKALENMLGYGDQRKHWRSICLHLMQELGVDTKDWKRVDRVSAVIRGLWVRILP